MPGRTPYEAVEAFLQPLRRTISCIASAQLNPSPGGRQKTGKVHALVVNWNEPLELRSDRYKYLFSARMKYEIVKTDPDQPGRWRVSTRAYDYEIQLDSGEVVVRYHWHPDTRPTPHMHVGQKQLSPGAVLSQKSHLSTSRVPLEAVIRMCIGELHVKYLRDDWALVLDECEERFVKHRSWG